MGQIHKLLVRCNNDTVDFGKMKNECDVMTNVVSVFLYLSTVFENDCQRSLNLSGLKGDISVIQRDIVLGRIRRDK